MDFEVVVEWSPVHELLASIWAFSEHRVMRLLEIGDEWYKQAVKQVGPDAGRIANLCAKRSKYGLSALALLRDCPQPMTPEQFLDWLEGLTPEELEERYNVPAPRRHRGPSVSLAKQRDDLIVALDAWNRRYFSGLDPWILDSLKAEARARATAAARQDPRDAVEDATDGIRIGEDLSWRRVVLSPQYHFRPYNVVGMIGDTAAYMYPFDAQRPVPGSPPPQLERLARAFSDPGRLRILRFLSGQGRTFTEILDLIGLAKSTVHYHMVILRAAGIVRLLETRQGTFYTLRPGYNEGMAAMLRQYVEGDRQ